MLEACAAASQIHLQLFCHAYFTVPLLHQASTVSRFPVILWLVLLLLLLLWALRALSPATQLSSQSDWNRVRRRESVQCAHSCGVGSGCSEAHCEGPRVFRGMLHVPSEFGCAAHALMLGPEYSSVRRICSCFRRFHLWNDTCSPAARHIFKNPVRLPAFFLTNTQIKLPFALFV